MSSLVLLDGTVRLPMNFVFKNAMSTLINTAPFDTALASPRLTQDANTWMIAIGAYRRVPDFTEMIRIN